MMTEDDQASSRQSGGRHTHMYYSEDRPDDCDDASADGASDATIGDTDEAGANAKEGPFLHSSRPWQVARSAARLDVV